MRRQIAKALLLALVATSCSESDLYKTVVEEPTVYDNKVKLSGGFCTTDPSDVVFPLKVLFIIDTSQSMGGENGNDPVSATEPDPLLQCGRVRAISDVVKQYINLTTTLETTYCNTGDTGCTKGSTTCAACNTAGTGTFMCLGPDCCKGTIASCKGVPICPAAGSVNGTCAALCDTTKAGCGPTDDPGVTPCPDCEPGDKCLNGICGVYKDPGVEFAVMRFGSAKQVITKNIDGLDGFTNDAKELVSSLPQVCNNGSVTDYEGALSMAYKVISKDINYMLDKNAAAVNRSKYVVIFLSDGEPYPPINDEDDWDTVPCYVQGDLLGVALSDPNNCDSGKDDDALDVYRQAIQEYNIPSRILVRVKEIMALKTLYRLGDIRLHTAFLTGKNTPSWVEDEATYLLKQMAQVGKGTFRSFPNNEEINFLNVGFSSLKRVFKLKNFIATNLSARPVGGVVLTDSDIDGLGDKVEVEAGTSFATNDTDRDGFSDLLEHFFRASGWDALDPSDADCPLLKDDDGDKLPDDTDGDGLLDCEERFLGTNRNTFDSDADGIPDGIEVRFGTNPVVVDVEDDLDFDGMPNGDEMRLHTDPASDDAAHRSRVSYRYHVQKTGTGIETIGLTCSIDEDCPAGKSCVEDYCRCTTDDGCSTQTDCTSDNDCTYSGESCVNDKCKGKWTCKDPLPDMKETDHVCAALKHVTCYNFEVENIALVTPKATPADSRDGWNTIHLYFGEAPFDNPGDYGNFSMACVKAWYDDSNGSKLPSTGKLTVPTTAWKSPGDFNKTYVTTSTDSGQGQNLECGTDPTSGSKVYCKARDACLDPARRRCKVSVCVCPDGKVGLCK